MPISSHNYLSRRQFLATTTAGAAAVVLHPFSASAASNQAHLRIMETTDIHVHVYPYDYYGDKPSDTVGLSRTASIIDSIRAEATNALLVENGDFLQGNPLGDYIAYERGMKEGDIHPVIAAFNTIGYDAGRSGTMSSIMASISSKRRLPGLNIRSSSPMSRRNRALARFRTRP